MTRALAAICVALLAVVLCQGRCAARQGERTGVLAAVADAARARADSAADRADSTAAVAGRLRAERDRYRVATDAATRRATETTRAASSAVATAERLAADSALTLDSLRAAVGVLATAWRADSAAHEAAGVAWLAWAAQYETIIAADSVAIRDGREALLAERVAGMRRAAELTARIPSGWRLALRTARDVALGAALDRLILSARP